MFAPRSLAVFSPALPIPALLAAWFRNSVLTALLLGPALALGQTFVQENNNTVAANTASVSVTYAGAETAGNLNVVVVGWNDADSSVISVADDNSNTYALAGTSTGNGESQAIYYAANIGLPTNNTPTVTVTFNQSASSPDVRILEYSGLSTATPLDNWSREFGRFGAGRQWRRADQRHQPDRGRGYNRDPLHRRGKWVYLARDHQSVQRHR